MESDPGALTLPMALLVLQTPSAPLQDRLNALRFLAAFLRPGGDRTPSPPSMDETTRANINKILFDSLLEMVMGEDRSADLRKRQLIRTECFIMLANVLKSQTLFGDAYAKIQLSELFGKLGPMGESEHGVGMDSEEQPTSVESASPTRAVPRAHSTTSSEFLDPDHGKGRGPPALSQSASVVSVDASVAERSPTRQSMGTRQRGASRRQRHVVMDALQAKYHKSKVAHMREKKGLKPRQGIIFGSSYDKEHFIPGADPSNWTEQDRRLGYRKERMWFPFSVGLNSSIIPAAREQNNPHAIEPEQIVQEYQQMKALMSYVGDLVMVPPGPGGAAPVPGQAREAGKSPSPLEKGRYDMAVREAVQMWTPILGANLPAHARRLLMPKADAAPPAPGTVSRTKPGKPAGPTQPPKEVPRITPSTAQRKMASMYDAPARAPHQAESSVLVTKRVLKELRAMEVAGNRQTKASIRGALTAIVNDRDGAQASTGHWPRHVQSVQARIAGSLDQELEAVEHSARVLRALMLDTVKVHFAQLPPRYLVVLEKGQATEKNPRQILLRAVRIFVRVKERTLLALALGVWRICLVKAASDAKRAQYSKVASCHLIRNWIRDRKFKQFKQWVVLWRSKVTQVIFYERFRAVVPIQTLYRRWRDRRIMLRMHHFKPYNGPLSDIYMGEDRSGLPGVRFVIPPIIRNSRRIYWRAAIKMQTKYRGYKQGKLYKKRIKQVVALQSICRMFPKRKQYLRLKRITVYCQACMRGVIRRKQFVRWRLASYIVQKYIRRFLGIMKRWRLLERMWCETERYVPPAIRIQCRWRIILARRRVKAIKLEAARVHWGALVMQRNWYRLQNAFHTFVLMCSYRAREGADNAIEQQKVYVKRFHNCRVVQRAYRLHYFKRTIAAAVRLQCWYRGRCGYSLVHILRRNKMAARRLHHWARGMMRKRHAFARRIQSTWWAAEPGRLRKHLMNRARLQDVEEERAKRAIRDRNAAVMQAVVRAIWARRWVVLHKAALKIQRSSRFFISRCMWKKAIRDRAAQAIKKSVGSMIGRGLVSATNILVRWHNIYVARVQALIRGVVLRCHFKRAKAYAFRLGLAVVTIQRFWRKSGAFMKAVQEVMALRRLDTNPYRSCTSIHEILLQMRAETRKYYSSTDPRCGLTIPTFLRRLGLAPEYLPMFPPRDFRLVADLQRLDRERLVILYNRHMVSASDKKAAEKAKEKAKKKVALAANAFDALAAPVRQALDSILAALEPPIPVRPTSQAEIGAVARIAAAPEVGSGHRFKKAVMDVFVRRFGTGYQSRVENLVLTLSEQIWDHYNNFKSVGYFVMTEAQISRAIALSKTPSDVKVKIDAFQCPPVVSHTLSAAGRAAAVARVLNNELEWDVERTRMAAEALQLAAEKAVMVVPPGSVLDIINTAMHYVGLYKRRFTFLLAKLRDIEGSGEGDEDDGIDGETKTVVTATTDANQSIAESTVSGKRSKRGKKGKKTDKNKGPGRKGKGAPEDGGADGAPAKPVVPTPYLSPVESVGRHFHSKKYQEGMLELNIGICKIYMEAFDKIYTASKGIQSVKNCWQNAAIKRAIIKEQMNRFLNSNTDAYIKERRENKVLMKWQKYRRAESVAARFNEILEARRQRLEYIDSQLYWVPRFGWEEALDEHGYTYWYKTEALLNPIKPRRLKQLALLGEEEEEEPTWSYEMPTYTRKEFNAVSLAQGPARVLVERVRERRRLKEEAKRTEVEAREAKLKEEMQENAGKIVRFRIKLSTRKLPWLAKLEAAEAEKKLLDEQSNMNITEHRPITPDPSSGLKSGRRGPDRSPSPPKNTRGRGMKDRKSPPRKGSPSKVNKAAPGKSPARRRKKETDPPPPPVVLTLEEQEERSVTEALRAFDEKSCVSDEDQSRAYKLAAEHLLPFSLQFEPFEDIVLSAGVWILVQDAERKDLYRSAVMFGTNESKKMCTVRYISGHIESSVPYSRLFQLNLEVGRNVEVRYHGRKLFYRATISKVIGICKEKRYAVRYEDGEVEYGIQRSSIRLSNTIVDEVIGERKRFLLRMYLRVRREAHYALQRERREVALAARNLFRWEQLPEEIRNPKPPVPPAPPSPPPEDGTDDDRLPVEVGEGLIDEGGVGVTTDEGESDSPEGDHRSGDECDESPGGAIVVSRGSGGGGLVVDDEDNTDKVSGDDEVVRDWSLDKSVPQLIKASVNLVYVKYPMRYGWVEHVETDPNDKSRKSFTYIHINDGTTTDVPQVYDAEELFNIVKIQSMIKVRLARKLFRRLVERKSISSIVKTAVSKGRKVCWVGHNFEGMTAAQLLYRAGLWRLVNLIDNFFKSQAKLTGNPQHHLRDMSISSLVRISPDQYGSKLGVVNQNDVKALHNFLTWYNSTDSDEARLSDISFVNSYHNEFDDRSIVKCIRDSEQLIADTFYEAFPNNILRMKTIGKDVTKSLFPITKMQLNAYIETYLPKPGAALNCIHELINKPTTAVHTEEALVWKLFRAAARDIHIKLAILKLHAPRRYIDVYIEKADQIYQLAKGQTDRSMSSGHEAKAALILRRHVLEYMLHYEQLIITVQRRLRGITQRSRWLKRKEKLRAGVRLAQRLYRGLLGRRVSAALAAKKYSDWEQLWNDKRQLLYYYNKVTRESTYREPRVPFRPLLRDKQSYALIQAWPDLDGGLGLGTGEWRVSSPTDAYIAPESDQYASAQDEFNYPAIEDGTAAGYDPNTSLVESTWGGESEWGTQAEPVGDPAFVSTDTGETSLVNTEQPPSNPMLCSLCKTRKYSRVCYDCTGVYGDLKWAPSYTNGVYSSKFCFSCFTMAHPNGDPETKSHSHEETTLAATLALTASQDTFGVTDASALAGGDEPKALLCTVCSQPATRKCMGPLDDRQIDALCAEIQKTSAVNWVSVLQRTGLWSSRRLRVLLDQVKGVDVGGSNVGASGRLSLAQVQEVRIMLERTRAECDDCYCTNCYLEVHSGGKRASHKWVGFQENAPICAVCGHSAAEVTCKDCNINYCAPCFRVFHSKGRKKKHTKEILYEYAQDNRVSRCSVCVRRVGSTRCPDCDESCCDSCLECGAHTAVCVPNPNLSDDKSPPHTASSAFSNMGRRSPSERWEGTSRKISSRQPSCVVCGEPADQECVQCRDHYCSRVWMGNPGCFAVQHSKGNRAKHVAHAIDVDIEDAMTGDLPSPGVGRPGSNGSLPPLSSAFRPGSRNK